MVYFAYADQVRPEETRCDAWEADHGLGLFHECVVRVASGVTTGIWRGQMSEKSDAMAAARKILQIIPADGWKARYLPTSHQAQGGIAFVELRLVCWALVEIGLATQQIVGMVAPAKGSMAVFADEQPDFVTYISN